MGKGLSCDFSMIEMIELFKMFIPPNTICATPRGTNGEK
jgi:hypothetical protein